VRFWRIQTTGYTPGDALGIINDIGQDANASCSRRCFPIIFAVHRANGVGPTGLRVGDSRAKWSSITMQTSQVPWLAVAGLLVAGAVGCGEKETEAVSRLSPRGVPYLEGVPVPSGFRMVKGQSTDYESAGQRNAIHVYEGREDPSAVRRFYREQMPLMGWNRISDQSVEGCITLRFEKASEACTVEVKPTVLFNRTRIHVAVSPFNRPAQTTTEPPSPRRPVP